MSSKRCERLAELVAAEGLDQLIVGDLVRPGDSGADAISNSRWLTGFTGTSGVAVIGPQTHVFISDFRYSERAQREVDSSFDLVTAKSRLMPELAAHLHGRVGFDDALTSVANFERLAEVATNETELVPTTGLVERLRRIKDEAEVEAIAEAARLTDAAYETVLAEGLAGRSEEDVARAAHARMRELGGEPSFRAIVAAGANGAQPHAEPSGHVIASGELVVWDMGAQLDGYCSDCTRTYAAGEPDDDAREVYELVRRSQAEALEAIRPGVGGAEADEVARAIIREGGHGDEFGHGLGHGVGLQVHEAPRLGPRSDDELVAGDVVTVEPGVYVPGRFGVRIEDLVFVTATGHRNLSSLPKELTVV